MVNIQQDKIKKLLKNKNMLHVRTALGILFKYGRKNIKEQEYTKEIRKELDNNEKSSNTEEYRIQLEKSIRKVVKLDGTEQKDVIKIYELMIELVELEDSELFDFIDKAIVSKKQYIDLIDIEFNDLL